jgi:hypothetical protein
MGTGEIVYIASRLLLGALAAFFAIILWSKTRDVAWMLMVAGAIAGYVETVYSILKTFGIAGEDLFPLGSVSLVSLVLSNLPEIFFIAAFAVMVARKSRRR